MRLSQTLFRTLRNTPADGEIASHKLMLRAGYIQPVASGIFSFLPLGWRSIQKIKTIITQEMEAAGAQEVNMPIVQPRTLWEESGRAATFKPPLASFEDRRGSRMVLAPTHEEAVVALARFGITSYRNLPLSVFQIQTKFRDELRPRGGLLRVREFEMKDAYSFDIDSDSMDRAFMRMAQAYRNIFERCGIPTIEADADSGGIGGGESREFIALAETGEDTVLVCSNSECGYAANAESAIFAKTPTNAEKLRPLREFATPGTDTIEALCELTGEPLQRMSKAVFYTTSEDQLVLSVVRGDYRINETKLRNLLGTASVTIADGSRVKQAGLFAGYVSAVDQSGRVKVVADDTVIESPNLIGGANKPGFHLRNINSPRDFNPDLTGDIALAADGYACRKCGHKLRAMRGIEVGHIFKLGQLYSSKMNFLIPDDKGARTAPYMGCYGIGIGRLLAAVVEINHDQNGMLMPASLAPFEIGLVGLNLEDADVAKAATRLYERLTAMGLDVMFDDRDEPPGVKFKDLDLIGIPTRIVVSKRGLSQGLVELKYRQSEPVTYAPDELFKALQPTTGN